MESNAIIRNILEDATEITKEEVEGRLSGEPVEKEIMIDRGMGKSYNILNK